MIKHVVIWRLKDNAHGNTREENANLIKSKVEASTEKIPFIKEAVSDRRVVDYDIQDERGLERQRMC